MRGCGARRRRDGPPERGFRRVTIAFSQLQGAQIAVAQRELRIFFDRLFHPLDGAVEILQAGERVAEEHERARVLRFLFQNFHGAGAGIGILPGQEEERTRTQLRVSVVRQEVGGANRFAQGIPAVAARDVGFGQLHPAFAEIGVLPHGVAVLQNGLVVPFLCHVAVAVGDILPLRRFRVARARRNTDRHQEKHRGPLHSHPISNVMGPDLWEQISLQRCRGSRCR